MTLNDILALKDIDPKNVLVFRHRPHQRKLNRVLPWIIEDRPDTFNAYQSTQSEMLERIMDRMKGNGYIASFYGHEAKKALFVGLYAIKGSTRITEEDFWKIPENLEMKEYGLSGFLNHKGDAGLWFNLELVKDFYPEWKGRLMLSWPPPERSWWRRAHKNVMSVSAILEDTGLVNVNQDWESLVLTYNELQAMPKKLRTIISQWRGIYYIFDTSDGKGYVGSAYGNDNILGRWMNYAETGHGGNKLLRNRNPEKFEFSILQRVSPDMDPEEIIRLENTWKKRLHTRDKFGLNDN
jgi:hypothetical protein